MKPVAIIGGGITGLSAAFALKSKGIPFVLYEGSDRAGGVIRSVRENGFLAECGPNTLLETSPKIGNLISSLGLDSEKIYTAPAAKKRFLVRNKKTVELPGSPVGLLFSPLFSWQAKRAIVREIKIPPSSQESDESIASFVIRRLGKEILDYAIDPMVGGIYAGDPQRLSLRHAFPKLAALERDYGSLIKGQIMGARKRRQREEVSKDRAPKISFKNGLGTLPARMADVLGAHIQYGARVQGISRHGEEWLVNVLQNDSAQPIEHSSVIFAGTAHQLAALPLSSGGSVLDLSVLKEIEYPPVASVVLGFQRSDVSHPGSGFGVLVPSVEKMKILGTIFSSSLFPNRVPSNEVLLTTYLGGSRQPEMALLSESQLIETTIADLRALLGVRGKPVFQHTTVYPRAIPQYNLGYERFLSAMSDIEKKAPGLFFAGHYRDGVSLSDSILSGLKAAEKVATPAAKPSNSPA